MNIEQGDDALVIYTKEHPDGEHVSADAVRGAITRLINAYMSTDRGPAAQRIARLAELELNLLLRDGAKP